jgi:hypothetical protein
MQTHRIYELIIVHIFYVNSLAFLNNSTNCESRSNGHIYKGIYGTYGMIFSQSEPVSRNNAILFSEKDIKE